MHRGSKQRFRQELQAEKHRWILSWQAMPERVEGQPLYQQAEKHCCWMLLTHRLGFWPSSSSPHGQKLQKA